MKKNVFKLCVFAASVLFFASLSDAAKFDRKEEDSYYVAVKAFEDGFYDVSLNLFERFLDSYLESDKASDAMIYIGQCYFFQEKYVKALDQFENLLKSEKAQGSRDKILYWLGEVYAKGRDYKQAATFYKELIKNYPDSYYILPANKSLASALFNEGRLQDALEVYRTILGSFKDEPTQEYAFLGICEVLYRLKDHSGLKKELSVFIARFPGSKMLNRAYFYMGEANFYLASYDEAASFYKKVIESGINTDELPLARLGLGWTYLKLKKFDDARVVFAKFDEDQDVSSITLGRAVLEAGLGQFDKALLLFDKTIASDKSGEYTTFAHFAKAEIFYHQGRYNDAIISYRTSLDKLRIASGMYTDIKELRDKIYYGIAWSYLKVGDFVSAQQAFQKVVSLSTDRIVKISAQVQLADTYQDSGDYKKAIQAYQQFALEYPDSVYNDYIQYQLGITWLKMDDLDSAVIAFQKLLKDYPASEMLDDACYYLGLAYFRKSDYALAKKQLQRFESEYKGSSYRPQAMFLLGETLLSLGELKSSIDAFGVVCKEADPHDSICQKAEYETANVYSQMGNEAEAAKRLSDFIAKYPDSMLSPDILFWLGQSYYLKKNYSSARKYFERLIRNYPEHELIADTYIEIGLTYFVEGTYEAALRNFIQAKESGRDASSIRAGILIGDVYASIGRYDAAIEEYISVAQKGQSTAKTAYIKMAPVFKKQKKYEKALKSLSDALSIEGSESNAEIQFDIAELFDELGRVKDAQEAYLKVYYLYPEKTNLALKALLRVSRIYEDQQDWDNFALCLEKISKLDVPEAKYAIDRLHGLNRGKKDKS
ncbi:MAG TPA: tetratricopeptide repeat protein [Candidatus Omnitrophota bacterium]|nr:tetratricopeptide repeat protein [Candidatus Omnitrophota bacterium]